MREKYITAAIAMVPTMIVVSGVAGVSVFSDDVVGGDCVELSTSAAL